MNSAQTQRIRESGGSGRDPGGFPGDGQDLGCRRQDSDAPESGQRVPPFHADLVAYLETIQDQPNIQTNG